MNDEELQRELRQALAGADLELRADLWPRMLQRMDCEQPARVPWFDWLAVAALMLGAVLLPGAGQLLLYLL